MDMDLSNPWDFVFEILHTWAGYILYPPLTVCNSCKALNVVSLCVFQPSKFVQSFGVCCKQPLWNVLEITL